MAQSTGDGGHRSSLCYRLSPGALTPDPVTALLAAWLFYRLTVPKTMHGSDSTALNNSPLGRESSYVDVYTPSLLHSIPRALARSEMALTGESLPFMGEDIWTAYELGWLDGRGRPRMGALRITVPATSAAIVESKSMKLYLNSFAQTRFNHAADVLKTLNSDLTLAFRAPILVDLLPSATLGTITDTLPGQCLDELDTEIEHYQYDPELLQLEQGGFEVKEAVHTRAFRSLCPVTGQPDWAALVVQYAGTPIRRESLYRYLVSFRSHTGFHEATIEQIFVDLLQHCGCDRLSVWARFMRRGGIDINPHRSTWDPNAPLIRLAAQ